MKKKSCLVELIILLLIVFIGYSNVYAIYQGKSHDVVNDNVPFFVIEFAICNLNMPTWSFQEYSPLDPLGRCGEAFCNLGIDTIPKGQREDISNIRPSGWQEGNIWSNIIDGDCLYDRCHLVAYILSGQNANEKNLITGTKYMNVQGMEPFELKIYQYIKKTHNHVLYRVTPIFKGNNLLAAGVLMEAYSVEDNGKGICFNVFCYNEQPGMLIDYASGNAELDPYITYEINKVLKKFHYLHCSKAKSMKKSNREYLRMHREKIISLGNTPCCICNP